MAANKPVWGVDLGQCALKALRLRVLEDKVEVLDHAYIEHAKILSQPEVDRPALIAESMKKLLDQHDLSKDRIVVGVPGQHTLARFTKLPPVDKKKIPEIVKYEAQQQIPFDMEEVIWDYQIFENPEAAEIEVGIFAMRREIMRDHLRFLSDLNLEPALVQAAPLALYNALKYDGLCGSESVAILDIGAQNTELLVVDGDSLWSRNIPIGGNNFTDALVKTFKLSFNKAENLKRSASSSKHAKQIFQAMRPVFADLVAEVQRSIGFFTQSRRGVKLGKLIAMGNAFKLPSMPRFVEHSLDMEVIRPQTFSRLSTAEAPNGPQLMEHLLSYGVAYGLAVQGLGLSAITSNLLPPEIAQQVIWRKKTPWFYGAAACLVAAAGLVWMRDFSDQRALASAGGAGQRAPQPPTSIAEAARVIQKGPDAGLPPRFFVQQVVEASQFLSQEQSKVESENQEQVNKAKEIEKLQAHKVIWPRILDMIHSALPSPEPEITRALEQGPQAYKALIETDGDKYERSKRKQVFIQKLDAQYSANVIANYEASRGLEGSAALGRRSGPVGTEAPVGEAPKPGFLITIVGRTPYAGGNQKEGTEFISNGFIAKLREAGGANKDVYFDKIYLVRCNPLRDVGKTSTGSGTRRGPVISRGAMRGSSLGPTEAGIATVSSSGEDKDPVTRESILKDWEFEIIFVALLGERPPGPATGGQQPPPGGAPPRDG